MKDIFIKAKVVKKEFLVLLAVFVLSFLSNIYAIIIHEGRWVEIYTQMHIVIILTFFLYLIFIFIRIIYAGLKYLWKYFLS